MIQNTTHSNILKNVGMCGVTLPAIAKTIPLFFDLFPEPDAEKHEVNEHHKIRDGAPGPPSSHRPAVTVSHHA